jgi:hypothetical protein
MGEYTERQTDRRSHKPTLGKYVKSNKSQICDMLVCKLHFLYTVNVIFVSKYTQLVALCEA